MTGQDQSEWAVNLVRNTQPLSEESVTIVYDFLRAPADYNQPLREIELWDNDWESAYGIDQGARRYVTHQRQKSAVNGELFVNESFEESLER